MEMIYDLVTNGLARLNLPLELNFLCIELCQIIATICYVNRPILEIFHHFSMLEWMCSDFLILFLFSKISYF